MRLHPVKVIRLLCVLAVFLVIYFILLPSLLQDTHSTQVREIITSATELEPISDPPTQFHISLNQETLDYMAKYLNVYYELLFHTKIYHVNVTLTNTGNKIIAADDWSIYFHHIRNISVRTFNQNVRNFRMTHVNGYLYRIQPTLSFPNLSQGQNVTFGMTGRGWIVRSDVLPNWYIVTDDKTICSFRIIESTASEDIEFVAPFDTENKWRRTPEDKYEPYTPEVRYTKNKIADRHGAPSLILPTPVFVHVFSDKDTLSIGSDWTVVHDKLLQNEADFLSSRYKWKSRIYQGNNINPKAKEIYLLINQSIARQVPDTSAYEIKVDLQTNALTITGSGTAGVFYGIQSFLQLLPLDITAPPFEIPAVQVSDYPRFSYRGIMVDIVRNFHTKQELFTLMDAMATYKLNKLHLHLSDDEGWRLEIPGLQELTQVGGQRCHDLDERTCILSMLGSGPFTNSSGSGYLTVSDYKELLSYAETRHITILPELDMPSHAHAAIHSMKARYYRLMQQGATDKASKFLLSDLEDTSTYFTGQRYRDSAINPCIESTYHFVHHVISALVHMHKGIQPLDYFHFGGDEVPERAFMKSPACAKFKKNNPHITTSSHLKIYFLSRLANIATKFNIRLQGWEDAFSTQRGGYINLKAANITGLVSNAWYHIWGNGKEYTTYKQANAGYKIVLTSATHFYLQNPQEPDPDDWGPTWATRFIDTKRTFNYRPDSFYDNIDFGFWGDRIGRKAICFTSLKCPRLKRKKNIIGISGALWTEVVRTPARLHQMLWPRMLAVAERAWHKADWENLHNETLYRNRAKDWVNFANSLGYRELPRLEKMGIDFYLPPPGVTSKQGRVVVNTMFPGLSVKWSKDKSSWFDVIPHNLTGTTYFTTMSYNGKRHSRIVTYTVPHN